MSRRVSAPVVSSTRPHPPPSAGGRVSVGGPSRQTERAREVLGKGVASQMKTENLPEESPSTIIHIIRLMLSCLHAWRLDEELDDSCEQVLGLVRPSKPVSFGLLSKGGCMSLVLPGWGLRTRLHRNTDTPSSSLPKDMDVSLDSPAGLGVGVPTGQGAGSGEIALSPSPSVAYTFDQKYHLRWQLSRALTTQHLLTMVSITNTLMNQTIGAHQLALTSATRQRRLSSRDEDSDSEGEDNSVWDNQIRAVWSRVSGWVW